MAIFSGTGNVQPVFNLDPCVMKHLWCGIVDSSINPFLKVCQITCSIDVILHRKKNQVVLGLVIWQAM